MNNNRNRSDFVFDYGSAFDFERQNCAMTTHNNNYKSAFTYQKLSLHDEDDAPSATDEAWPFTALRKLIVFFLYMLTVTFFPFSVWICIKRVHALERIVLMRLGKLQPVYGPGFVVILPCVDEWTRVDLHPRTCTLSSKELLTADGGIIEAEVSLRYQVCNVINYVTKLSEQEHTLKDLGLHCLTNLISQKDQEDVECKRSLINESLMDELNRTVVNWGLEILDVSLQPIKVLKAAEPVSALNVLTGALKASIGQSSGFPACIFPQLSQSVDNDNESPNLMSETGGDNQDYIDILRDFAQAALNKGIYNDLKAVFKFVITGKLNKIVFCCFDYGNVSVFEDPQSTLEGDVTVALTSKHFAELFSSSISPIQAYLDGKISLSGDSKLIQSLAKAFESPPS